MCKLSYEKIIWNCTYVDKGYLPEDVFFEKKLKTLFDTTMSYILNGSNQTYKWIQFFCNTAY